MKELLEYRRGLLEALVNSAGGFQTACLSVQDPYAPLEAGGWNVHQIAVHVRDVHELVYGLRARRTAEEQNPEFQNFDGESYIAEHYRADEPLDELLRGFVQNVKSLVDFLQTLPADAWSRQSRHATLGGGFSLQTWVERDLVHIREHLASFQKN